MATFDPFDPSTWSLLDTTTVPGDQGLTTVDITGTQTDASAVSGGTTTYYGTGAPQYPGDPTADTGSTGFSPATQSFVDLLPSTSQLSTLLSQVGNLISAGTGAYVAANQYTKVPVNTGNGITGSAYVNSSTGLPAGSQTVSNLIPSSLTGSPLLILGAAAALFFMLSK